MRYQTRRKFGTLIGTAWLVLAVVPAAYAQFDGPGGPPTAAQPPRDEPPGQPVSDHSITFPPARERLPSWEDETQPAEPWTDTSGQPEPAEEIESDEQIELYEPIEPPLQEAAQDAKPLRGPKYLNLRYDEDFSYLDGPKDSFKKDFFDPIKWMHLTDDLTLTIGGEFRARLEAETNRGLGSTEPA